MSTNLFYDFAAKLYEKIPINYRQVIHRVFIISNSSSNRYRKYIVVSLSIFLCTILLTSHIYNSRNLNTGIDYDALTDESKEESQPGRITKRVDDEIAEEIVRDVWDQPTSFKWVTSEIGPSKHTRLFYNRKAMWNMEFAKKAIEKVVPVGGETDMCKAIKLVNVDVSVIIDIDDVSLPLLPFTLGSVFKTAGFVTNFYIVQDGSVGEDAVKSVEELVWDKGNVEFVRAEGLGLAEARMAGVRRSSTDVVVFIKSGVLVTNGWLEPLISHLKSEPTAIVVPTYDRVDYWEDNALYYPNKHILVNTLRMGMSTHLYPLYDFPDTPSALESPGLRGDVLAVKKENFLAMGGYDDSLLSGAAAHAELSMRQWLCQGSIKTVRCSRVAIQSIGEERIGTLQELLYVSHLWTPKAVPNADEELIRNAMQKAQAKRAKLPALLRCSRDETWYEKRMMPQPGDTAASKDMIKFSGKLRVGTGICIVPRSNGMVFVGDCDHTKWGFTADDLKFEYNKFGYITFGNDMCLTTGGSDELQLLNLETCVSGEARQRWAYSEKLVLKSIKGGCLKEISNPANPSEEITERIPCEYIVDGWGGIKLVMWEFVKIEES